MASQNDGEGNVVNTESTPEQSGIVNQAGDPTDRDHGQRQTNFKEKREIWENFAKKNSEDMYQRCPGSAHLQLDGNSGECSGAFHNHGHDKPVRLLSIIDLFNNTTNFRNIH